MHAPGTSTRTARFACHTIAAITTIVIGLSQTAFGAPITNLGSAMLNMGNGSVLVNGNGVTVGCIDWFNGTVPPTACAPGGTTGTFTVESPSTAPFVAGMMGTIQDINFNSPSPLVNFITIDLGGGTTAHFDLADLRVNTGADIGSCTVATGDTSSGATCTPAGSPFQITNGIAPPGGAVNTVSVSLSLDAWGYTGTSGTNYNAANRYIGIFTTQGAVNGAFNIESILSTIRAGGSITASWSATLTPVPASVVPEPQSYFLIGLGMVSIVLLQRRRNRA
jgi:archaellum component FlaF (FlaF/FlaG flagellin family)